MSEVLKGEDGPDDVTIMSSGFPRGDIALLRSARDIHNGFPDKANTEKHNKACSIYNYNIKNI